MTLFVYSTLPEKAQEHDLPDDIVDMSGAVLNSYVMQDGLTMKNDQALLDRLMGAAELFMRQFYRIAKFNESHPSDFRHWLNTLAPTLDAHAEKFQGIYQFLKHLREPPYFATAFSVAFAVDAVVSQHPELQGDTSFYKLPKDVQESIEYTTRFMDNLIQEYYSNMIHQST